MDSKDILRATESTQRLVQDENYFKYIFKKTEKVVSVVFYIVQNIESDKVNQTYIEDILKAARHVHDAILESLQVRAHVAEDAIRTSAHALITLDSKLRVSQAAGFIAPEVMTVLSGEIDAVLRGMNKYLKSAGAFDDLEYSVAPLEGPKRETRRESRPRAEVTPRPGAEPTTPSPVFDRRERIKTVLDAKGEASIKDISEVISDVSEKTIQRELNAMIEDNIVKRQGERRWSRYSLF